MLSSRLPSDSAVEELSTDSSPGFLSAVVGLEVMPVEAVALLLLLDSLTLLSAWMTNGAVGSGASALGGGGAVAASSSPNCSTGAILLPSSYICRDDSGFGC